MRRFRSHTRNSIFCSKHWRVCNGCETKQSTVSPILLPTVEEVRRLRAQVADLQQERASGQETDESRAKKARTLSGPIPALDVGPVHGVVGGSSRAFRRDANCHRRRRFNVEGNSQCFIFRRCRGRYGLRGTRVGEASNPGPPKHLNRLRRGVLSVSEPRHPR